MPFLAYIIVIANLSAILIGTIFVMRSNTIRWAWVGLLGHDSSILIG